MPRPLTTFVSGLVALCVVVVATVAGAPAPAGAAAGRVPGRPRAATAWSGDATAFVRWAVPLGNGAPITGYVVTPVVDGRLTPSLAVRSATGTATVPGLANGSTTRFRVAAVNAAGAGPAVETGAVRVGSAPLTAASSWLDVVNYVRQTSRVPLVAENPTWAAGLRAHQRYLANTPAALRVGTYASAHTENPASAWYSASGQAAGASADLTVGPVGTPLANIDDWLAAPFHAIGIIRPALQRSAYAASSKAAGIDVIRGLSPTAAPATRAVLLPGPGAVTTARSYDGTERPNPLDSCPGFTNAGRPIVALLTSAPPARVTASLRQPDGTVLRGADVCVITARTYSTTDTVYGPAGRAVLADSNAVIIIPRTPLQPGRQTVSLAPAGTATITWSFSVIPT